MKHVNLRLPDDLHERAKAAAAADDRSLNSWLIAVVRRAVADSGSQPTPHPQPAVAVIPSFHSTYDANAGEIVRHPHETEANR